MATATSVGRIASLSGADPEICERGAVPPVPLLSPSSLPSPLSPLRFPSEVGSLNQLEGLGSAVSFPVGFGAEPRPITNFVHFKSLKLSESHWWQSFSIFEFTHSIDVTN